MRILMDAVAGRPVDKTAALVTQPGKGYVPNKKILQRHWESPPKPLSSPPPDIKNLVGMKFGFFTVFAYYESHWKNGGSVWLVRCNCGHYETRRSKAVLNPDNNEDRCDNCRHLQYLHEKSHFLVHRNNRNKAQP